MSDDETNADGERLQITGSVSSLVVDGGKYGQHQEESSEKFKNKTSSSRYSHADASRTLSKQRLQDCCEIERINCFINSTASNRCALLRMITSHVPI